MTDERSIDRGAARSEMFPSESLFTAIHADREREIERRNRDWRLLHPEPGIAAEKPATAPRVRGADLVRGRHRAGSSGSACEAI
jgi:hypothetical protein